MPDRAPSSLTARFDAGLRRLLTGLHDRATALEAAVAALKVARE